MPRATTVIPIFAGDGAPRSAVVPNAGGELKTAKNKPLFEVEPEESVLGIGWHLAAIGMLLMLILTAYGNSFQSQWVLDNKYIIELDPRSKTVTWEDAPKGPGVREIFTQDYWWPKGISGLYRPLMTFSYWMNWTLFKNGSHGTPREQVIGFHWVNLGIHWLNAILVYFLLLRLVKRFWVAFFSAALFATHPIATESVTNIIGRADMIAATTIVGGLLLYIRATRSWGWPKVWWLFGLSMLGLFGVFSKESSLAIGFVVALYDLIYRLSGRMKVFSAREFVMALARVVVIAPIIFCAVRLYLLVIVPWMHPMAAGQFTMALMGTLIGLIGLFFGMAMLSLRKFWITAPTVFGSALLIIALSAAGDPTYKNAPPGTHVEPRAVLMMVLGVAAALFVLVEWLFANVWLEEYDDEAKLVKWQGFWDGYFTLLPVAMMMWAVRIWVDTNGTPAEQPFLDNPLRGLGFVAARLTATKVWGLLFGKLIWPVTLSSDYSFNQIPLFGYPGTTVWENAQCILWLFLLLGIVALGVWLWFRNQKAICFFIFLYLINYIPTSNWPVIIGSIMAERFMYLPLIGFVGILVIGVDLVAKRMVGRLDDGDAIVSVGLVEPPPLPWEVKKKSNLLLPETQAQFYRWVPHFLLSALVILYGIRAFYRNYDWHTDVTLWESAIKTSPKSFRSYQSLAFALFEQDAFGNIDRMIDIDEHGLLLVDPLNDADNSSRLYLHLGMYYGLKGESLCKTNSDGQFMVTPEARPWFEKSAYILERGSPIDRAFNEVNRGRDVRRGKVATDVPDVGLAPVYGYLGGAYMRLGLLDEAEQTFRYQRHLEPTDADAYFKMAKLHIAKNRLDLAAVDLVETILLDGNNGEAWQNLNEIYKHINTEPQPCIVIASDGRAQLDLSRAIVRDNLLDAYRDFVRTFRKAKRTALLETAYKTAIEGYKFPINVFKDPLTEPYEPPKPAPPVFYKPGTKAVVYPTTQSVILNFRQQGH